MGTVAFTGGYMKVIKHKHVIPIIRNTLNALDARLVDSNFLVWLF